MPFTADAQVNLRTPATHLADLVWNLDCNWFDQA